MAAIQSIRNDKTECYRCIKKAINDGFRFYTWLSIDPLFENMRDDQQFEDIIAELKITVMEMRNQIEI